MTPFEFPYRPIPDPSLAAELHEQAASVKRELTEVVQAVVAIGRMLAWAQDRMRPELFAAWLFSEFGWTGRVADTFVDAAVNFEQSRPFNPVSALEMAKALAPRSVCAAELVKARKLIVAYREIIRGDVTFTRWPKASRPRTSIHHSRIRTRIYRASLKRPDSLSSEDLDQE